MLLVLTVLVLALAFEFINGFHDTANAVATSVATKVLTPRQAILLASVCNLAGALAGTAVATTIGTGLVAVRFVTPAALTCALLSGIGWNLMTWRLGLPSSSSHALIGGLCGAALAMAGDDWSVIRWAVAHPATHHVEGLWPKVVLPMMLAPALGIVGGFGVMGLFLVLFHQLRPSLLNTLFRRLQFASAAWMSFSHGTNDAQKTMGVIALTLYTATTQTRLFDDLPAGLGFLRSPDFRIYVWIKLVCALTIAAGTAAGGWRIINTVSRKMVRLQPIHGFAAQTTAAAIIHVASHWGMPLSTTHVITAAVTGVGSTKGLKAVRWNVVEQMAWAWVLTLPVTGLTGYLLTRLGLWCGR